MNESESSAAFVVVYSTSQAIKIEKLLQEKSIASKMVPVPRQVSSDCGVCLQIDSTDIAVVEDLLSRSTIEIQGIFQ
jgi:hypothetical protein